ncbi:MAG: glycosyltransferase family 4 protein [Betaproteobacteria bacterium]|nr:glycosyltransferase family 4 protein [Betaproteobacteria bacterium]
MSQILHIVRNAVTHDSRVLKETGAILKRFPERNLVIAGFHDQGYAEQELIGNRQVYRWRLKTRPLPKDLFSQAIKFFEWRYRLVSAHMKEPLQVIHNHDLEPLPIAVKLKKLTGAKLIYDAHELETERNGSRGLRKKLSSWTEKKYIDHVDHIITVSPSIRDWYKRQYPNKPVSLVRNIPNSSCASTSPFPLRETLEIHNDALLFLYLGGLTKGRGVEAILDGFEHSDVPHHVLFMGSGPLTEQVKAYSRRCARIHYRTPVPPSDVLTIAQGADIGLCHTEDTCLNHRYCLPNKLFECLLSGLPVLASDLPDQAQIVRDHQAGWVISPRASELTRFLVNLDARTARELRFGLRDRVSDLRWDNEAKVLIGVYEQLLA